MRVDPLRPILGGDFHGHVGRHALFVHVHVLVREDADARDAESRTVDEPRAAGADDQPARGLADDLAQPAGAEGVREDFRVAVAAVVDDHRHRLAPLAVEVAQHLPFATVALDELRVILADEVVQHLVVGEAAAVVADVDDDGLFVEVVRIEAPHEDFQPGFVHAGDVDVPEFAAREFIHLLGVLLDPAVVHERPDAAAVGADDLDPAGRLRIGGSRRRQRQCHGVVDAVVQ